MSHGCDKIHWSKQFKGKGFILGRYLSVKTNMGALDVGAWEAAGHIAAADRKQRAVDAGAYLVFSFLCNPGPNRGEWYHLLLGWVVSPQLTYPRWCAWRLVSQVILDLVELTINIITDMLWGIHHSAFLEK